MSETHSILSMSDEAFGWYLSGLADGEGCFAFRQKSGRLNGFCASFIIALRADETSGLEAIASRFGFGTLRLSTRSPRKSGNRKPVCVWQISRFKHLALVVVPHFDKFPLSLKKRRDFAIWREAILLMHSITLRPLKIRSRHDPKRIEPEDIEILRGMAEQLKKVRQFDSGINLEDIKAQSKHVKPLPLFGL